MPSDTERVVAVVRGTRWLFVVPAVATLVSLPQVATALTTGVSSVIRVAIPLPTGLPTLWTYTSLRGGWGGLPIPRTFSPLASGVLLVVGVLLTGLLEAGFLASLSARLDGRPASFVRGVRRFGPRMIGVELVRYAVLLLVTSILGVPLLGIVAAALAIYAVYGLPFEVVVAHRSLREALRSTVRHARAGGAYLSFGVGHLVLGAFASIVLGSLVRVAGAAGIVLGAVLVAVPAVLVATSGLVVFRGLDREDATNSSHTHQPPE